MAKPPRMRNRLLHQVLLALASDAAQQLGADTAAGAEVLDARVARHGVRVR